MDRESEREEVLGPKYAVRVGALRNWHTLHAICVRCGHIGWIHPRHLDRFGQNARLIDLEPKLRCSSCRNRDGNSWRVMRLPR